MVITRLIVMTSSSKSRPLSKKESCRSFSTRREWIQIFGNKPPDGKTTIRDPPIGDIRMIVGGTATTGSSKKAHKTYLKIVQNIQLTALYLR